MVASGVPAIQRIDDAGGEAGGGEMHNRLGRLGALADRHPQYALVRAAVAEAVGEAAARVPEAMRRRTAPALPEMWIKRSQANP